MADEQFIIFRLGDQEYGIAIAAVDEIARLPEQIVRLPKAPAFIDGVINMRGVVVPIVDLRRRFDIASTGTCGSRRILVLSIGGGKTGFHCGWGFRSNENSDKRNQSYTRDFNRADAVGRTRCEPRLASSHDLAGGCGPAPGSD